MEATPPLGPQEGNIPRQSVENSQTLVPNSQLRTQPQGSDSRSTVTVRTPLSTSLLSCCLALAPFLYEADLRLSSLLIFLVKGQNHNASYYSSTILYIPASINRVFGDMTRLIGLL